MSDLMISPILLIENNIDLSIPELEKITLMHPKGIPVIFIKQGKDFLELQVCEPRKYGSWFINQRISSNNSYSLATKIDPRFLCLQHFEKTDKFSPLDQIIINHEGCDRLPLTDSKEWGLDSICDINNSFGEHMILYRYNETKTIEWLKEKINKISKTIAKQRIIKEAKGNINFVSSFNSGAKVNMLQETKSIDNNNINEIKVENDDTIIAAQILCEYLSEKMIGKFIAALGIENSELYSATINTKRKTDWELELEIEKETLGFEKKVVEDTSTLSKQTANNNNNNQPKKKAATQAAMKNSKPIAGVSKLSNFFTKK